MLTTSKARSHCVLSLLWPAQFSRKFVLGTRRKWLRPRRDRDVCPPRPRRGRDVDNFSRDETETRRGYVSRPSRDRDVETETTTLGATTSTWNFDWWGGATRCNWTFGSNWPRWSEIADFRSLFARSDLAVKHSEKSSINTNRKSTTRFPMSPIWTSYVFPKTPKKWLKNAKCPKFEQ